ncbi:MAG: metal-dependent transcriptional regulator [Clostridiales bacterium]|nr:metal-dependent transcriptional regulator [Clostridiales bacterium]
MLSLESDKIRAKDISECIGFTRPSVSRAINSLKEKGLVRKDTGSYIKLTEGGLILAKHIHERHTLITKLFTELGVDNKTAEEDASRIERFLSDTTLEAVRTHLIKNCN